ncbi:MAG TPA: transposase [Thermomicrobiales bacterium]|nr:transposase [Thermomicrobiales bacterium]
MRKTLLAVYVHLVWGTWDRLPLLTEEIEGRVYRAVGAKAVDLGAAPVAIGGTDDHVHLLVRRPATLAIADLVQGVKGTSAHLVNHQLPPGGAFNGRKRSCDHRPSPRRRASWRARASR